MSEDNDYVEIPSRIIRNIAVVRLYKETLEHIEENHAEVHINLPTMQHGLANAITNPTLVEASGSRPDHVVFVDHNSTNKDGHPLRVPVKAMEGNSGLVKTAFFGNGPESAVILFRASNEK